MILRILRASKKKVDKDSRGARCASGTRISADRAGRRDCGSAPFEPPFLCPAADLPFPRAAGRLKRPFGRKPPADKGNARKAKEQSSSFSGVSVRWGCAGAFALPGKTGAMRGPAPGNNRVRARLKCRHKHGARLARRRRAGKRPAARQGAEDPQTEERRRERTPRFDSGAEKRPVPASCRNGPLPCGPGSAHGDFLLTETLSQAVSSWGRGSRRGWSRSS